MEDEQAMFVIEADNFDAIYGAGHEDDNADMMVEIIEDENHIEHDIICQNNNTFYCAQCTQTYNNIEEFKRAHQINEELEQQQTLSEAKGEGNECFEAIFCDENDDNIIIKSEENLTSDDDEEDAQQQTFEGSHDGVKVESLNVDYASNEPLWYVLDDEKKPAKAATEQQFFKLDTNFNIEEETPSPSEAYEILYYDDGLTSGVEGTEEETLDGNPKPVKKQVRRGVSKSVIQPSIVNDGKYFCNACKIFLNDYNSVIKHAKTHPINGAAASSTPVYSSKHSDIKLKCFNVENFKQHECPHCRAFFKEIASLKRHFSCCRSRLQNYGTDSSYQTATGEWIKVLICNICPNAYKSLSSLRRHYRVTHETLKTVICNICNTEFSSEKNLKLHLRMHDQKRDLTIQDAISSKEVTKYNERDQFYCEICNKSFDESLLGVHKNMHSNLKEFKCGKCNKGFETKSMYVMHMQIHGGEDGENAQWKKNSAKIRDRANDRFQCQYCESTFARPHEKVKHERVHTGEKPYKCEVCGKCFRVTHSLTLHLRTHTDLRPFKCNICNKGFKSKPTLVHHRQTHLEERPYDCKLCNKRFRTSVQVAAHVNSHNKPFHCEECQRSFSSFYALKNHAKTHDKTRNQIKFECELCGSVYPRLATLTQHMRSAHHTHFEQLERRNNMTLQRIISGDDGCSYDNELVIKAAAQEYEAATLEAEAAVNDIDVDDVTAELIAAAANAENFVLIGEDAYEYETAVQDVAFHQEIVD